MSISRFGPNTVLVELPIALHMQYDKKDHVKEVIATGTQNDVLLLAGKINVSLTQFGILDEALPGKSSKCFAEYFLSVLLVYSVCGMLKNNSSFGICMSIHFVSCSSLSTTDVVPQKYLLIYH
jgi:hypothetical protein